MGFLDEIAEAARRLATQDDWYQKNEPYILEIRSVPGIGLPIGLEFMILPLAPENYKVSRVFRQSVTPTLGGLVAEERGLLWRIITVSGSFGLKPKFGFDTSVLGPDPTLITPLGGILSGPAWTRRMIRNYFEKYAELKADPLTADLTEMLWHDTKTGDSWTVVPEHIDVDRTSSRRGQYPWSFQLKAIAKAELLLPIPPLSALNALGKVKQVISAVNKGLALVNSAIQEASRILGEVRYFVASIDSIVDKLTTIADSAKSFVDGVTSTISVGAAFISSTAQLLESGLELMEAATDLPDAVRQNFQTALDGLHAIGSQVSAFGTSYQDKAANIASSESGASRGQTARSEDGTTSQLEALEAEGPPASAAAMASRAGRSSDQDLVDSGALAAGRTFGNYSGFRDYAITSTDTLQSIAAKLLGDGGLWFDLAIVNGLKPPYISKSGIPGTVKVGDIISVPQLNAPGENAIVAGEGSEPGEELLGVDIALTEAAFSAPGRPVVDIRLNRSTLRDIATISGFANFAQALQMRVWTEQGSMPLAPGYGLRRTIGVKSTDAFLTLLRLNYLQTIRQDSRVQGIGRVRFEPVDDLIEVDVDVIPKGSGNARAVSTSLV